MATDRKQLCNIVHPATGFWWILVLFDGSSRGSSVVSSSLSLAMGVMSHACLVKGINKVTIYFALINWKMTYPWVCANPHHHPQ